MNIIPITASIINPVLVSTPMAAEHHNVAAVLSPLPFSPPLIITPAPKKPIPQTTWAAILVGLPSPSIIIDTVRNKKAPNATNTFVLIPAIRCLFYLSTPIAPPKIKAIVICIIKFIKNIFPPSST